jgi:lysophospholipase L1-like esterase
MGFLVIGGLPKEQARAGAVPPGNPANPKLDKLFSYRNRYGYLIRRLASGDGPMFHDFAARALAVQNRSNGRRLAIIDALARGIAENLPKGLPGLIDVPIAEDRSATTRIASGEHYKISGTAANDRRHHYGLYGADWLIDGPDYVLQARTCHHGDGSNPAASPTGHASGTVRFATFADKFEVWGYNNQGWRLRVNGKYCKTGMYAARDLNGGDSGLFYWLFDFTGTEFAGNGLKLVEIQAAARENFGGVRVPKACTVHPWPQPFPLKAALHGDSMIDTVAEGTDHRTRMHGLTPHIVQTLTGIPNIWANNIGGAGFVSDGGDTRSTFIEQAGVDFRGAGFDLIWNTGGRNDWMVYGSEESYRATVRTWIDLVLADNPDTIVILTGPIPIKGAESHQSSAAFAAMQRAKKAAAAAFPLNCAFIETLGNAVTNDPWVFGTGTAASPTGDGNADLVIGTDGTHPTAYGHQYFGTRLVSETARVLPLLASRIRHGMLAGVNDGDLAAG